MIGIIGSGNVGANTAFFLAEKGVDHVLLYDVQDGLAQGKALDMMEAAPIRGYRTSIRGTDQPDEVLGCDIIIITAGAVRQPGEKRESVFAENRNIIEDYAREITNPSTKVLIVSEPIDPMVTLFAAKSNLPPGQVIGLGGVLDATRLRYRIAKELSVSMENVAAQVIGRHADEMILLKDYCCVSGVSLDNFMSEENITRIFEETRNAGHLIVDLAVRASAYYGPSAVAVELAEAICRDTRRLVSVSTLLSGQFGIEGVAMSLPAVVGKNGVSRIVEPRLTDGQIQVLQSSAEAVAKVVKEVVS